MNFIVVAGVAHFHLDEKTVELSFRQAIDTFLFHRILSCQDHERQLQRECLTVDGDLIFLHCFQKG